MAPRNQQLNKKRIYLITGGIGFLFVAAIVVAISFLLRSDGGQHQKPIQMVTIVTPPPPPPPKAEEKMPEPPKIEEKIDVPKEELSVEKPEDNQNLPPSDNLGLDADAGLGSDAFGLAAKKGGSNLIGGTGGNSAGSLYGWYANVISSNLQKTANDIIQKDGGVPPGKWDKVTFEVMVDVYGKVTKFSVVKSSGNEKIDGAVKKALQMAHSFEPAPPGNAESVAVCCIPAGMILIFQELLMKPVKKKRMGQIGLIALAGVSLAGLHPAAVRADSTEEIINLLKAKNIITAEEAAQIIERHKGAAAQAQPQGKPVTIIRAKGQNTLKATTEPVSQDIKDEVSRQVKQELKEKIASEVKEAYAASVPGWTQRIRFGGDIRLRYQDDMFDDNNAQPINPAKPTEFLNRDIDRERLVYQARLSATAQVNNQTEAGFRLTTGNESNPISTNDTLGDYMNKDTVTFDLAYLKWSPFADSSGWYRKMDFWGGRLPNPFIATDLVWDSDLNFEGVAFNLEIPVNAHLKALVNAGAFPLQEVDFSSRDKWLVGGQLGVQYTTNAKISYTLAAAYYDFQNIQGQRNPTGSDVNNFTAPLYQQTGNVLFNINEFNTGSTLFGLAADYKELNFTGIVDVGIWDPVHVVFVADYVKNVGFDSAEVNALTGGIVPEEDTGYAVGLTVGYPKMQKLWDWQTSLTYKYLEADAVVDAYTDSDFHLGGTNAKGWILGGQLGVGNNLWVRARWLSADVISGPPNSVDTLQFDINSRF